MFLWVMTAGSYTVAGTLQFPLCNLKAPTLAFLLLLNFFSSLESTVPVLYRYWDIYALLGWGLLSLLRRTLLLWIIDTHLDSVSACYRTMLGCAIFGHSVPQPGESLSNTSVKRIKWLQKNKETSISIKSSSSPIYIQKPPARYHFNINHCGESTGSVRDKSLMCIYESKCWSLYSLCAFYKDASSKNCTEILIFFFDTQKEEKILSWIETK